MGNKLDIVVGYAGAALGVAGGHYPVTMLAVTYSGEPRGEAKETEPMNETELVAFIAEQPVDGAWRVRGTDCSAPVGFFVPDTDM